MKFFYKINGIFLLVRSLCVADNRKLSAQIGLKIITLIGSNNWKYRNKGVSKVIWICGFQLWFSAFLLADPFPALAPFPPGVPPGGKMAAELHTIQATAVFSSYDASWIPESFLKQPPWLGAFHVLIGLDLGSSSNPWWAHLWTSQRGRRVSFLLNTWAHGGGMEQDLVRKEKERTGF